MLREILIGTAAGAVGTVTLNAVTYGDMVVRGGPASSVPSQVAGQLVDEMGVDLSAENEGTRNKVARRRRTARAGLALCKASSWGSDSAPPTG